MFRLKSVLSLALVVASVVLGVPLKPDSDLQLKLTESNQIIDWRTKGVVTAVKYQVCFTETHSVKNMIALCFADKRESEIMLY